MKWMGMKGMLPLEDVNEPCRNNLRLHILNATANKTSAASSLAQSLAVLRLPFMSFITCIGTHTHTELFSLLTH